MGSPALLLNGVYAVVPLLAFLAASIVAFTQRARIPRRATFAAIGFGVLFIGGLPSGILSMAFPLFIGSSSYSAYSALSAVFGVLRIVTLLAGVGLLAYTLFVHERPAPDAGPPPGHAPPGYAPGPAYQPPGPPQGPWVQR